MATVYSLAVTHVLTMLENGSDGDRMFSARTARTSSCAKSPRIARGLRESRRGAVRSIGVMQRFGIRWSARTTYLLLGVLALAIGVAVVVYRGPGRAFVRGHVGDVAATMLVFAIVSLVTSWRTRSPSMGVRALITMTIATSIEVAQVWFHARSTAGHLVLGSTFDPIDLGAYVVGVMVAIAWERAWAPRSGTWKARTGA